MIEHVNIEFGSSIIHVNSSHNTKSSVLLADWFILENNEKTTVKIDMPY